MNNSQTLYVPNPRIDTEAEEWKRPREGKRSEPANKADLLSYDVQSPRHDEKQLGRNATATMSSRPVPGQLPADHEPILTPIPVLEEAPAATVRPQLVPPSKMQGTWFREEPW